MVLIKNNKEYWEFIRELRNMDGVREGFIQQEYIEKEFHEAYMQAWGDCFFICLYKDEPAGYVGIINKDIRVATHPDFQGKGVGTFMINTIMDHYPDSEAKIKIENEASLKLFEKCGFKKKYYILEKE